MESQILWFAQNLKISQHKLRIIMTVDNWYLSERQMLGRRASLLGELVESLPNSAARGFQILNSPQRTIF